MHRNAGTAHEQLSALVRAAIGRETEVVIGRIGGQRVAELLLGELAFRCRTPVNQHKVAVQFDLLHDSARISQTIWCLPGEAVRVELGSSAAAVVELEAVLEDLVDTVFGPATPRAAGRCAVRIREQSWLEQVGTQDVAAQEFKSSVREAIDVVLGSLSERPSLAELAIRHGCDKWGVIHWFTPHYENYFNRLRELPVRVLEVGIGGYRDPASGGESLRMWKSYFGKGCIVGLDITDKSALEEPRIQTVRGNQQDIDFLDSVADEFGKFDVIIDDGSHVGEHVLATFDALFPRLRPGGWYVIEDLWSAYCPNYGGSEQELDVPGTSVSLLKQLIDEIHHEEWAPPTYSEVGTRLGAQIIGMHVHHNIVFIEKGTNVEGGIAPRVRSG